MRSFFEFPDGQPDNLDLVFRKPDGTPIRPRYLSQLLPKLGRRIGLPPLSPHGLRHSYASMLVASGQHMKLVSDRLGHSTIGLTYDKYSWVLPSADAATAAHGADLLFTASDRARWVRKCVACREVDETVRYASEADAALNPDWICPSCGSAVAEMVELDHGSAAGNDQQ